MIESIVIIYLVFAFINIIPCVIGMLAASTVDKRPLNYLDFLTLLYIMSQSLYGTIKIYRDWKKRGIIDRIKKYLF